jgi:DNA-binding transcriptional LysR family regulator
MTLRHLKIFIMVSDFGSMTAATKALFIAQPIVKKSERGGEQ